MWSRAFGCGRLFFSFSVWSRCDGEQIVVVSVGRLVAICCDLLVCCCAGGSSALNVRLSLSSTPHPSHPAPTLPPPPSRPSPQFSRPPSPPLHPSQPCSLSHPILPLPSLSPTFSLPQLTLLLSNFVLSSQLRTLPTLPPPSNPLTIRPAGPYRDEEKLPEVDRCIAASESQVV